MWMLMGPRLFFLVLHLLVTLFNFQSYGVNIGPKLTQSKSKTIITRSMLTISLIVFTDKLQGHVHTFYSKWYFITS